jgi:HAMP domain-containing protein
MTLRSRLLLAYGYLVMLVFLAAGGAVLGFLHLSSGIDRVLEENFTSIRSAMEMLDILERQDSALLVALLEGKTAIEKGEERNTAFEESLEAAATNVTEDQESGTLIEIGRAYEAFDQAGAELLLQAPERPLAAYNARVLNLFFAAKESVRNLLRINQDAMIRAGRDARRQALQNGAWLGFFVILALVSLIFLSRSLQRDVLARLAELRNGTQAVIAGDTDRRLYDAGDDELALIARGVNRLLDDRQSTEARLRARLTTERRILLGLCHELVPEGALFDLSGDLVASGRALSQGGELPVATITQEIRAWQKSDRESPCSKADVRARNGGPRTSREGDLAPDTLSTLEHDGRTILLELLHDGAERPVGWLVREAASPPSSPTSKPTAEPTAKPTAQRERTAS